MNNQYKDQESNFGQAFRAALYLVFINIFLMPLNIWHGAMERLSVLKSKGILEELRSTELMVFNWFKYLFDSLIFLSYLMLPITIIVVANTVSSRYITGAIITSIFYTYFLPLLFSFIKELITLALIQTLKIEKIEKNTRIRTEV